MKKLIFILIFAFLIPWQVFAKDDRIEIWFFHSNGCPHCAQAEPVLEQLAKDNERVELLSFELTTSQANQERFLLMAKLYNKKAESVPTVIIGDKWIVGYDPLAYKEAVEYCLENDCENPSVRYKAWLRDPQNKEAIEKMGLQIADDAVDTEMYKTIAFLAGLAIFIVGGIVLFKVLKK